MPLLKLVKSKVDFAKKTEEYYNAIRTNIQFSGAQIKVIAISSVEVGEGKSTTSVNLAISFASVGLRTLLIDADTRNSVLSGTFKSNEPYKGLSNFLSGNADLNETICQTDISGLDVIASGPVPPNPTSLLQNDNFRHLMEVARSRYDYVIIDTPPIGLVVIDAGIIAHQADASLLVTAAGKIKRRFVTKAVEQLKQSGSQFLGVVLNKVDMTVDKYGSYGSYGSYGEYGKKTDQKEGHSRAHRRRKG
ncbi:tyrosine-protein kinase [Streptococcus thermophilus]|uniref:tyrosine-protein kinase n=1 Tax=Streptococcus thermophilus TaxID=1308 RepID=UPI0015C2B2D3|nr:tyrosine-protein kinase [Streptococcus thermophilus]MCE2119624.1 polysaccharide biosynthesis tyrosine autokinase [Streptococcus thermophilus]MCT2935273.1 tyrosine-protein kinase [Streptococcus thermophilus]CAD0142220.1 Tyrosine-protein kinase CpsD [Streptococcus thermophilus]